MKKLMILAAMAAMFAAGCSVTKVEYEKNDKGEVSYRVYRNSHWLKMDAEGMSGGMSGDGKFEIALDGMKSSPSEEFNKVMKTYTSAVVTLAQIAAAAYNPSSSMAAASTGGSHSVATESDGALGDRALPQSETGALGDRALPTASECKDGSCAATK